MIETIVLSTVSNFTVIMILLHVDDQKVGIFWMRFLKVDHCGIGMLPLRNFFWAHASPNYIMPCILSVEIQSSVFSRTCNWMNTRFYKKEKKNKSWLVENGRYFKGCKKVDNSLENQHWQFHQQALLSNHFWVLPWWICDSILVCFFYEFDWLTWLGLWVLTQAETMITTVTTYNFRKCQSHSLKMIRVMKSWS